MMNGQFVTTDTVLDKILARKVEETAAHKAAVSLADVRRQAEQADHHPRDMMQALQKDSVVALIAEVKQASPSKGLLTDDFAPVMLALTYDQNGASAVSVLTDEDFFMGSLSHLQAVRTAVSVPVLRKDFIIDPYQVYAGRAAGADAVLLIVAALSNSQLRDLHDLTTELKMAALVEVHNEVEMERALKLKAKLIGINNRDLKTFDLDLTTAARLSPMVDDDVVLVAESGIQTPADVKRMGQLGAHAVLVGESLVQSNERVRMVRAFSSQRRG